MRRPFPDDASVEDIIDWVDATFEAPLDRAHYNRALLPVRRYSRWHPGEWTVGRLRSMSDAEFLDIQSVGTGCIGALRELIDPEAPGGAEHRPHNPKAHRPCA